MKRLFTPLLLLFLTGIVHAQQQSEHFNRINEVEAENERTASNTKQATWPSPFHPSQDIGADSQVSFPADI